MSSLRNFPLKKCSGFEVADLHKKTNRVAASVTVDESLNQTCFFPLFFLSNEYLCTILVLLSYLLIIEPLTQVT